METFLGIIHLISKSLLLKCKRADGLQTLLLLSLASVTANATFNTTALSGTAPAHCSSS